MSVITIAYFHRGHGRFTPFRREGARAQGTTSLVMQLAQFSHFAKR